MIVQPRQILWPTDFSPLSLHAARYAKAFREAFGARLHVIHVVPPPLPPDLTVPLAGEVPVNFGDPELVLACREQLTTLIREQFGEDPEIVTEAFYGHAWSAICEYASKADIDLIIVSTHGRTGLKRVLIGSTAERIVQHAPCPVLVIKGVQRDFVSE